MKRLKHLLEAGLVYLFYGLFKMLPLDTSSALGGFLGRLIGRFIGKTKKAERRIAQIFPDKNEMERALILSQMWDNIGRTFAEYPHLRTIGRERVTMIGDENISLQNGAILYGIHAGNWEIAATSFLAKKDIGLTLTYRAPNNPHVDRLLYKARCFDPRIQALPKARESGKLLLSAAKNKKTIGILIDQKYNEGIQLDFFGTPAMTNPVFAQLASRFNRPLIGTYCKRLPGKKVRFELSFETPMELKTADGSPRALEDLVKEAHLVIEKWINDDPGSWLWLHNRWG